MSRVYKEDNQIYDYLISNRRVGHTRILKDGAKNAEYPFYIIGADMKHAKNLASEIRNKNAIPLSMQSMRRTAMGTSYPAIVDNHTFTQTCENYMDSISQLELIIEHKEEEIKELTKDKRELIKKKNSAISRIKSIPLWVRIFKSLYLNAIKMIDNERN